MNCRPAERRDMEEIKVLLKLSFDRIYAHYARQSLAALTDTLVAEEAGVIIGFVNWRLFDLGGEKLGYLFWLAVHPDRRRRGVALMLVRSAVAAMRAEIGPAEIYAAVEEDNLPSRGLLEKAGFVAVSRAGVKQRFGRHARRLFPLMMLMPWEVIYRMRD